MCETETLLYIFFFSFLDFISHIFKICSVAVLPVNFCVYMYTSVHVHVLLFCTPNILESHPLIAALFFSDQFCSLYHQKIQKTKNFNIFSYFPLISYVGHFLKAKKSSVTIFFDPLTYPNHVHDFFVCSYC